MQMNGRRQRTTSQQSDQYSVNHTDSSVDAYCQQRKFRKHVLMKRQLKPPRVDGHILSRISENLAATARGGATKPVPDWRPTNMERRHTKVSGPPAMCA